MGREEHKIPLNGYVPMKNCQVTGMGGFLITEGVSPPHWKPIQLFCQMIPSANFGRMRDWTNMALRARDVMKHLVQRYLDSLVS